jgi:Ni,Fe-hydrogenase III small subunit/ferredoxin
LTTRWPKQDDPYFDGFATTAVVRPDAAVVDADRLQTVAALCPTDAIAVTPDGPIIDRGRCVLCGRCVKALPEVFDWQRGGGTAEVAREGLLGGGVPETDQSLRALRAGLAAKVRYLGRSVHIRHVDAGSDGSDEWEVQALVNPVYDIHRLGVFFTASPRHADILLVTGIGSAGMAEPLRRTREAMPDPVVVIATGSDAISGGLIGRGGYTSGDGIGGIVDVDIWVPGAPASPFTLMHAILMAIDRLPRRLTAGGEGA